MLSWSLWRALQRPPLSNPQYRRVLGAEESVPPWYVLAAEGLGLLLFVPILIFTSSVYGLAWVVSISSTIATEYQRKNSDLLGMTPDGMLGASWAMCMGCLYRNRHFSNVNRRNTTLARAGIIGIVLVVLLRQETTPPAEDFLVAGLYGAAAFAALLLDHVQTIVLSCLIGMNAAARNQSRADSQIVAFGGFLGAQVLVYGAALYVGFGLVPALLDALHASELLVRAAPPVIALVIFGTMRTGLIAWLWRRLGTRLNADLTALDFLHKPTL